MKTLISIVEQESKFIEIADEIGVNVIDKSEIVNGDLIFIHKNDLSLVIEKDDYGNERFKNLKPEAWKILFGGNDTRAQAINYDDKTVEYLNREDLRGKLKDVDNYLKHNPLVIEDIYQLLFNTDIELESLIKPYTTLSPAGFPDNHGDRMAKIKEIIEKRYTKKHSHNG